MSELLLAQLEATNLISPPAQAEAQALAAELAALSGLTVYPRSISAAQNTLYFLGRRADQKFLGILPANAYPADSFIGESKPVRVNDQTLSLMLCPTTPPNIAALRAVLPFLVAKPLGLAKSAGCGDRLGLATPGHLWAIRKHSMAPILTQQSMRENARTGRSPQEVMDDATWGVFQEGWRAGFGADADHLKNTADIDLCAAAGYTFYTIDPGEYVDNSANTAALDLLEQKVRELPWKVLDSNPTDLESRLSDKSLDLGDFSVIGEIQPEDK